MATPLLANIHFFTMSYRRREQSVFVKNVYTNDPASINTASTHIVELSLNDMKTRLEEFVQARHCRHIACG